jgi:hypothetical protein
MCQAKTPSGHFGSGPVRFVLEVIEVERKFLIVEEDYPRKENSNQAMFSSF